MPVYTPPVQEVELYTTSTQTPGFGLTLTAEVDDGVEDRDSTDPFARVAAWVVWIIIAISFGVYLLLAQLVSTDSARGPSVAIWSVLLVLPILFFMLGTWLLGCRRELSGWRVVIAVVLSAIGGFVSIATQYGGFVAVILIIAELDYAVPATYMVMMSTVFFSVLFTVVGEFVKAAIIAIASVEFDRSKRPMGFVALSAIASMAYVTFESLEYAWLLWLLVPNGWVQLAFVAFRMAFGIMVDCFTGVIYGAKMSKYSVIDARNNTTSGCLGANFWKSVWVPLLFHLAYDLGMFFGFSMFLTDMDRNWFYFYFIPATFAVVAGAFAFVDWRQLRKLVKAGDTPVTSFEMGSLPVETVV